VRNYLKQFKLGTNANDPELQTNIVKFIATAANLTGHQEDAVQVLENETKRLYYLRVHFQHQAMKAAVSALKDPMAEDTHRWHYRLNEFDAT